MPGRPFSSKQKKKQLQEKRERKANKSQAGYGPPPFRPQNENTESHDDGEIPKLASGRDRYKLEFQKESRDELQARKERSMQPYTRLTQSELECSSDTFYSESINFPQRPTWNYKQTAADLEHNEQSYFYAYKKQFLERYGSTGYCELNLETWRQLWRVLEMSDVVLLIADVRFAPLHFNPVLYKYIRDVLKKPAILIINKADFVSPHVAVGWKRYFEAKYPELQVCLFTSFPKDEETRVKLGVGKQSRRNRRRAKAVGPMELWKICNKVVEGRGINIDSWKRKIQEDITLTDNTSDTDSDEEQPAHIEQRVTQTADLTRHEHIPYQNGIMTIGCVGYPNVGKSSVINALMGHKVVSISVTPGHTKHFQTIFLTDNVRLCDCPGLVFPSTAPRPLQVLAGLYPIAQLREPYSTVQYLAERTDIVKILQLKLPSDYRCWSAYIICDVLAELKGYKTARGARTDPYRAANFILRKSLDGSMMFCLLPEGFSRREDELKQDEETRTLLEAQLNRLLQTRTTDELLDEAAAQSKMKQKSQTETESETESESDEEDECVTQKNAFALLSCD